MIFHTLLRNLSEKTILSCSLTPRQIFPLVGTATLLKRQNAIIPKRIFQERDPCFFAKKCDQALGCPSQTHFRTSTRNLRSQKIGFQLSLSVQNELFFQKNARRNHDSRRDGRGEACEPCGTMRAIWN